MAELPTDPFANLVWNVLQTKHRRLAVRAGDAARYPTDICPFVAVREPGRTALQQLRSLLAPGESVWLGGSFSYPAAPGLRFEPSIEVLRMVLPSEIKPPPAVAETIPLTARDAPEMFALTQLAFPEFYRPRTHEMGSYFGIRSGHDLIAMGGERLMLEGFTEISGLCTHPAHRGHGHAANIIWTLVREHRRQGITSFLHVAADSLAIPLYLKLGFQKAGSFAAHRLTLDTSDS